jgi:hypothetical protein
MLACTGRWHSLHNLFLVVQRVLSIAAETGDLIGSIHQTDRECLTAFRLKGNYSKVVPLDPSCTRDTGMGRTNLTIVAYSLMIRVGQNQNTYHV